jgi:hypothetical protein
VIDLRRTERQDVIVQATRELTVGELAARLGGTRVSVEGRQVDPRLTLAAASIHDGAVLILDDSGAAPPDL